MLQKGDRVLVCVSGGPDSIFLLYALNYLKRDLGIRLFVANLDHGIRGKRSKIDSAFVKKLSRNLSLDCFYKKLDTRKYMNKKLSIEENLRLARYEFFKDAAKKLKTNVIATGHTLDDNAETVLMRIIKGTSLKGLAGIPPTRSEYHLKIIRPLLEIEKTDILDFLEENNIDYRLDHTNSDESFLRNRVRRKLLPYMSGYNPKIKIALANMAESLREDLEFIKSELLSKRDIVKRKKLISIDLKDIVVQPRALQREILGDALTKSGANIKKLSFSHWKDMNNFLKFKRKGQALDLPGNVRIIREDKRIIFKHKKFKH